MLLTRYLHFRPLTIAPSCGRSRCFILNNLVDMEHTVTVGTSVIQPVAVVLDLGVLLDQELSMSQHIARVTSSCFYQLR